MKRVRHQINPNYLEFICPGCKRYHVIPTGDEPNAWEWNGSLEKPTFKPSLLVWHNGDPSPEWKIPPYRCHSFITDGRIKFLSDCTHEFKDQTLDLVDWDAKTGIRE